MKINYWSLLLGLSLTGSGAVAQTTGESLRREPGQMVVVGHAGSGFFTPLNPFNPLPPSSLRSELKALKKGAEGLEIDLQLSQDSVPVLYHDTQLDTMTKTGRGCTNEHPAAELTQLRFSGGWPYDWFQREHLITLDTLLTRLARRPQFPYLHLDLHEALPCLSPAQAERNSAALARQLVRLLQRHRVPAGRILIVSDQVATLRRFRQLWPALPLSLEIADNYAQNLALAQAEKMDAVVLGEALTTPQNSAQAHAAGLAVVAFGARSRGGIKKVAAANPDAYEVDNVGKLLRILGRPATARPESSSK
jgi:glycerophosphoryl diester phosphodiesterase